MSPRNTFETRDTRIKRILLIHEPFVIVFGGWVVLYKRNEYAGELPRASSTSETFRPLGLTDRNIDAINIVGGSSRSHDSAGTGRNGSKRRTS